jgi:hypothetical protein
VCVFYILFCIFCVCAVSGNTKLFTKDGTIPALAPTTGAGGARASVAGGTTALHPLYPSASAVAASGGMSYHPLTGLPIPTPTFQSHSLAHAQDSKHAGEAWGSASASAAAGSAAAAAAAPTKTVTVTNSVAVKCGVMYIDFEGRSDGRSIKKILSTVLPRKLILIHASDAAKEVGCAVLCCAVLWVDGRRYVLC